MNTRHRRYAFVSTKVTCVNSCEQKTNVSLSETKANNDC